MLFKLLLASDEVYVNGILVKSRTNTISDYVKTNLLNAVINGKRKVIGFCIDDNSAIDIYVE